MCCSISPCGDRPSWKSFWRLFGGAVGRVVVIYEGDGVATMATFSRDFEQLRNETRQSTFDDLNFLIVRPFGLLDKFAANSPANPTDQLLLLVLPFISLFCCCGLFVCASDAAFVVVDGMYQSIDGKTSAEA